MSCRDQSGITLVELLVAVVIMSIIIIPILTLMTNSSTRTATQGKESQLIYFAQEIIEQIKSGNRSAMNEWGNCSVYAGCNSLVTEADGQARYTVTVTQFTNPYGGAIQFNEVKVEVTSLNVVSPPMELVTVIRR